MIDFIVRKQRSVTTYDAETFALSLVGFIDREVNVHTLLGEWQSGTLLAVNEVNVVIGHGRGASTFIPLEMVSGVRLYPQA